MNKCKHGRDIIFCCKCNYDNTGKHDLSPNPDEPRDLVDDMNLSINRKLKDAKDFSNE